MPRWVSKKEFAFIQNKKLCNNKCPYMDHPWWCNKQERYCTHFEEFLKHSPNGAKDDNIFMRCLKCRKQCGE